MKIFIIGTGKIATALGTAFLKSGHSITGVLGRDLKKTNLLAKKLKCTAFLNPAAIPVKESFYLIAIKDDAIRNIVEKLPVLQGTVAHTSGASSLTWLNKFKSHGVFYPVQTVTSGHRSVSFTKIPLCIEANDAKTGKLLSTLAGTISKEIYMLNSDQRATLHVAAVFANNFTNYMLEVSKNILEQHHLPVSLLETLAKTTVENAFTGDPHLNQTGPAVRNDVKTIAHHLQLLEGNKLYQQLYRLITSQIRDVHKKK